MNFRPMLAAQVEDLSKIFYPVFVSPKIDGIRCITTPMVVESKYRSVPVTRSLKRIPNEYAFCKLSVLEPGFDGELVAINSESDSGFFATSSEIMSHSGKPKFAYYVFDWVPDFFKRSRMGFKDRLVILQERYNEMRRIEKNAMSEVGFEFEFRILPQVICNNEKDLQEQIDIQIAAGFEGVCIRTAHGLYKFGRSTLKEEWLLKYKVFEDTEAEIIGFEALRSNQNTPKTNELGYQSRNFHKAGMVEQERLGALIVSDPVTKVEFNIGSGFTNAEREMIWNNRKEFIGQIVKYKHQPHGRLKGGAPRSPIFLGVRHVDDL